MQKLILILTLVLLSWMFPAKGQTNYDTEMQNALRSYALAQTPEQFDEVAKKFDLIVNDEPTEWLPLYYSMLMRTIKAFMLEPEEAIQVSDDLEKEFGELMALNPDKSEALTLQGMFKTVKLAMAPMRYGMTLSPEIAGIYEEAMALNPENPRPVYLIGQFGMKSAPYYGANPKDYCPVIQKSIELFEKEETKGFEPGWGKDKAEKILETECAD